jgi:hypothetical protein
MELTQRLGHNGSISYAFPGDDFPVATWNGQTNSLYFHPANGGPKVFVGRYSPEYIVNGLLTVERLHKVEQAGVIRRRAVLA